MSLFFLQAEDGIRDYKVTGVQTCALPISLDRHPSRPHYPDRDRSRRREEDVVAAARDERQMPMFDWVADRRDRITFGLHRPDDPEPSNRILVAGQLADDLGLDAFYVSDHPA